MPDNNEAPETKRAEYSLQPSTVRTSTPIGLFKSISNVGRLEKFSQEPNHRFDQINLIYAPNGRGKSTLCDILRSYSRGEPEILLGRRSLQGKGKPEVQILVGNRPVQFDGTNWSESSANIEILDDVFVSENLYIEGAGVGKNQKRNLLEGILGKPGIELREDYNNLKARENDLKTKQKTVAGKLKIIFDPFPIENFVRINPPDDLDKQIDKTKKIAAVSEKRNELIRLLLPEEIHLAGIPQNPEKLLNTSLEEINREAAYAVQKHIEENLQNQTATQWIQQGTALIKKNVCPFCGQNTEGVALIEHHYAHYFDERYVALQKEVESQIKEVSPNRLEIILGDLENQWLKLEKICADWKDFLPSTSLNPEQEIIFKTNLAQALQDWFNATRRLLSSKAKLLLDVILADSAYEESKENLNAAFSALEILNVKIRDLRNQIAALLEETQNTNPLEIKQKLARLLKVAKKNEDACKQLCEEFVEFEKEIEKVIELKKNKREELTNFAQLADKNFPKEINRVLHDTFNTGFRIHRINSNFSGAEPNSSFELQIGETPFKPGDEQTNKDQPNFKNTLSAGDKRSLSFAFFTVMLTNDPDLEKKIIVFDDPFISLDRSRRGPLCEKIRDIARTAKQLLIFSHEPWFLKELEKTLRPVLSNKIKEFELVEKEGNSAVIPWNSAKATRSRYVRAHDYLEDAVDAKNEQAAEIPKQIRIFLEDYLMARFVGRLTPEQPLGKLIEEIRNLRARKTFEMSDQIFTELEDLNSFSVKHEHGNDASNEFDQIDYSGEAGLTYARRTLDLVRKNMA